MESKYDAKKAANWLANRIKSKKCSISDIMYFEKRTSYKERQKQLKAWKEDTGGYGQSLHSETHKYLSDEEDKF